MGNQRALIITAITGLLAFSITATAGSAYASDEEKCWGVAKAGRNACNTNKNKHTCAGHSQIASDSNDYIPLPKGSCEKIGGKLEPDGDKTNTSRQ